MAGRDRVPRVAGTGVPILGGTTSSFGRGRRGRPRPYDLRHAAVSTWLNGGAPEFASWAGHTRAAGVPAAGAAAWTMNRPRRNRSFHCIAVPD
ncbi:hypothetical protein FVA95_25565 [Pseudonocardia sp. EV170527-09]|nr:hypothetical protein FVA95_25565 [Pseudonocardia sp. EV170527-09]